MLVVPAVPLVLEPPEDGSEIVPVVLMIVPVTVFVYVPGGTLTIKVIPSSQCRVVHLYNFADVRIESLLPIHGGTAVTQVQV